MLVTITGPSEFEADDIAVNADRNIMTFRPSALVGRPVCQVATLVAKGDKGAIAVSALMLNTRTGEFRVRRQVLEQEIFTFDTITQAELGGNPTEPATDAPVASSPPGPSLPEDLFNDLAPH